MKYLLQAVYFSFEQSKALCWFNGQIRVGPLWKRMRDVIQSNILADNNITFVIAVRQ